MIGNGLHSRYTIDSMGGLWTEEAKFQRWLRVELAYLQARADVGLLDRQAVEAIASNARIDVERIDQIEKNNVHDLLAFVEQVRESLQANGAGQYSGVFHTGLTSYDVEDPALMLVMREALELIIDVEEALFERLLRRAEEHEWTLMIARTHGQYAEPTTFGVMLLEFARAVERDVARLHGCIREVCVGKMSGAVGSYGSISPLIERRALAILELNVQAATQILGRDSHATVLNVLAVTAGTIERMARTLWQMTRSDVGELEEPRKSTQKGSSAMAHKKNPIKLEQLFGLPRLVRSYAQAAMENIASIEGRTIDQSSVERHIIPGAFSLTHYMAVTMEKVIAGLVVHEDVMRDTLEVRSKGVWASQQIRNILIEQGVDPEEAYTFIQAASFEAQQGLHLKQLLVSRTLPGDQDRLAQERLFDRIRQCFDARPYVAPGVKHLFGEAITPSEPPISSGA